MTMLQVKATLNLARDIADLRGQHRKPMCGDYVRQWTAGDINPFTGLQTINCRCVLPKGGSPYLKS